MNFVGRVRELQTLDRELEKIRTHLGEDRPGRCLLVRGRRRVGKSRLVEEFVRCSHVPAVFYAASGVAVDQELAQFHREVRDSDLPGRPLFTEVTLGSWEAALRLLAQALPDEEPSIVVLDEVPYLAERADNFEGTLQRCWDRYLERKPVLLILIGSDMSMMEALGDYGRPFHQRGRDMVVGPLTPREVQRLLGLGSAAAFDAYLVTGGLPLTCLEWPHGVGLWEFLAAALADPTSALLVSAERTLAAEFPTHAQARDVLGAIGSGERTFTNIARAAGGITHAALNRALVALMDRRVVASELPLSTRPSRERRYYVADPYLRFWLRFLGPNLPLLERARPDIVLERIRPSWASWRGRAIEPLVREALARLLPDRQLPAAEVGGFWTRTNDVEIDIVGADRAPIASRVLFIGSIKWLEDRPFDDHDLTRLTQQQAALVGDTPVPRVAVSRSGVTCSGLAARYGPDDLLGAWPANV